MSNNNGYTNGSDLLLSVGGKAIGHCSTHTLTMNSTTKEHAVKPVSTAGTSSGLWNEKTVTGLSMTVSAEGFRYAEETENGFTELSKLWGVGSTVEVLAFERGNDTTPSVKGSFIITSLEETAPAQDDTTYKIELENAGEPEIYPGKATA